MTKLQLRQSHFLDQTIKHFARHRRAVLLDSCIYSAPGCAIGRHIKDQKLCKKLDNTPSGGDVVCVFRWLPDKLKTLGKDFLVSVQQLHDRPENWVTPESKTGSRLSEWGRAFVKRIRTYYNLSKTK